MRWTIKFLLTPALAFFIIACNDSKKPKYTIEEISIQKSEEDTFAPPPPPPPPPKADPPKIEMKKAASKCFVNDGLKYKIIITIFYDSDDKNNNKIAGSILVSEQESGEQEVKRFIGTMKDDQINVNFSDDPPAIGAASEWTSKPWTIKKVAGKEVLRIIFNAKNYESNKWENTPYEFELSDCGN